MALSCDELMQKGDTATASGKPGEAIKLYKMAIKDLKSPEQTQRLHHKMFLAYLDRIKELDKKDMKLEAVSLQKQAMEYMPDPASMDQATLILVIGMSDTRKAFDHCKKYVMQNGMETALGVVLADRLISENAWDLLEGKKDTFLVSRDAAIVKSCVPLMDAGQWQQADEAMKSLPRKSFFAHIRMFCRAMALFCAGDDKNMLKAISLIPEVSVFKKITDTLESGIKSIEARTPIKGEKSLLTCLWDGPATVWETAEQIIAMTEKKQFNAKLKKLITSFARQILPDDPGYATQYLLETLWQMNFTMDSKFSAFEMDLLPRKAEMIEAKRGILFLDEPLENADFYIDELKASGVDSETLALLESVIILHVCHYVDSGGNRNVFENFSEETARRFALSSKADFETILMQCAARGIACDPGNRSLYELVAGVNAISRESKTLKEQLLLSMCDIYPDDPYPCIELASLYHGKNAFRKAENILKKAMEFAPYDSRVQDQHVISLLISADKCLNKNNFPLVWKDVEKARSIDTGSNALLIREKALFYKICEKTEMPEKFIGIQLDDLSGFERFKIVSMLRMDVETKPKHNHPKISRKIKSFFEHELKKISSLTSKEVLSLMTPFPREWQYLFKCLNIHQLFFQTTDEVLTHLNDTDLITLADRIFCPENALDFQEELNRRTFKRKSGDELLMFYSLVINGIKDNDWDIDEFMDLLEDLDPDIEEKIRDAGKRLSLRVEGPHRHALQTLDFEFLEDLFMASMFGDDDLDDYEDYDDDFDEGINPFALFEGIIPDSKEFKDPFVKKLFSEMSKDIKRSEPKEFQKMFETICLDMENMIDAEYLRGAANPVLQRAKARFKKDKEAKVPIALLNLLFFKEAQKHLSKEAKAVFLY